MTDKSPLSVKATSKNFSKNIRDRSEGNVGLPELQEDKEHKNEVAKVQPEVFK